MKILIDADGCPVVDITIEVAKKLGIEVILMCDTSHIFNKQGIETIILSKGADSVDFALVNKVKKDDIVVTQDYGLAAMVLAKSGNPISQNGKLYTSENIDQLLFTRHISKKARNAGSRMKGPKKRQKEDDINFKDNLIKLINNLNNSSM